MRAIPALLVAVGLTAVPVTALAEASSSNTANVGPISTGQSVSQGSAGFGDSGTSAQASNRAQQAPGTPAGPTAGGPPISLRPLPFNTLPFSGPPQIGTGGAIVKPPDIPIAACPPGQTALESFDATGAVLGIVCTGPETAQPGAPVPTAAQLAEQASAAQPWPNLQVSAAPRLGLTGLTSSFWLNGSPRMPDATASAGPLTITVHAALADITWTFGDGAGLDSGTDAGTPERGIQHIYQTDSLGLPGYPVTAVLSYEVTYSVNGGPAVELGVKARPYVTSYAVNQLQPEAVSVP